MQLISETLEQAVEQLARLPGMGRKSAQRIAMHLLKQNDEQVLRLSKAIADLKKNIRYCSTCFNITDQDPCPICSSEKRNTGVVCVVEEPKDVYVIERTREFNGRYHVLGGVISPLQNVGPDEIRVNELIRRIRDGEGIKELILALNPDAEGEATGYYINKLAQPMGVDVTRIAHGIPMGTDLEFIDDATLTRAFAGRRNF
ncbi:recombination mediator RecR [Natronogracilivirga saccharolytica]|uniref:Recombination protein RecR n=1 Tax=Natronogracilivirga saccharolytica TaxID=2812953 RepID=A0A8J7RPJ1_9BACT|nr:recombination mediator RecR [Natronogracilivirga saccharolytica]MBP3191504.1 recombination protein RecR [Natronogracilivirga saccharolytica]